MVTTDSPKPVKPMYRILSRVFRVLSLTEDVGEFFPEVDVINLGVYGAPE